MMLKVSNYIHFILILAIYNFNVVCKEQKTKIVGLIQVKNEAEIIETTLRILAMYTDSIVLLDNGSYDNTVSIVKKLASQVNIEKIIAQNKSLYKENNDIKNRNILLESGRSIGGTHFILIDAQTIFSSQCLKDNWLRKKILSLKKGQALALPMVHVWDSIFHYRDDSLCGPSDKKWKAIVCALYDDGKCNYNNNSSLSPSGMLHFSNDPVNRICATEVKTLMENDLNYSLIQLKCANLKNVEIQRVWHMCLDYIQAINYTDPAQEAIDINEHYKNVYHEFYHINKSANLKPIPQSWYIGYRFFNPSIFALEFIEKKKEVGQWFTKYGKNFFEPLNIWHVDWVIKLYMHDAYNELLNVLK